MHAAARSVGEALRRVPFTLFTLAVLAVVGFVTGTHSAPVAAETVRDIGFAPRDLFSLEWYRLVSSALVTSGGIVFVQALAATAAFLAAAEWLQGSRRTFLTVLGVHLAALVLSSAAAYTLHLGGSAVGSAIVAARDVGPSAGYFAAFGLAAAALPPKVMRPLVIIVAMVLAFSLGWQMAVFRTDAIAASAALAHAVAFPLGFLSKDLWDFLRVPGVPSAERAELSPEPRLPPSSGLRQGG